MTDRKTDSKLFLLVLMGMLSALGPFLTDFYLPALPVLGGYFGTTASLVQLSFTFGMVGLAAGQLVIGPLSDKYGRRVPLLASLSIFCISTLGCIYSGNIYCFLLLRLLQGMSGAGGVVISKSVAADLYDGKDLIDFFSLLGSIQGLAPICAPVLGGLLLEVTDWKGIFMALLAVGLVMLAGLCFFHESLPPEKRQQGGLLSAFRNYMPILRHGKFMGYVFVQAFATGAMFVYIATSPFIFQEHFSISSLLYSICFGLNALGIMFGSLSVSRFAKAEKALGIGVAGFTVMSIPVGLALLFSPSVIILEAALFIFLFFLGMILPSSTALALDLERENSGNASAVLGFLIFFFGGLFSSMTGLGNMIYTTAAMIFACCVFSSISAYMVGLKKNR